MRPLLAAVIGAYHLPKALYRRHTGAPDTPMAQHRDEQMRYAAARAERQRISRDLHDSFGQTLFAAKLILNSLPNLVDKNTEQAQARVAELHELLNRADDELREILSDTRPDWLTRRSLTQLINHLGDDYQQQSAGALRLVLQEVPVFAPEVQYAYYYIVREALNNNVKHAGAALTTVELTLDANLLALHIRDDGIGFDPTTQKTRHYGLTIMRERAQNIGAQFRMTSQPGAGTHIEITTRI